MAHYPYLDANGNIICDAPVVVTGATAITGATTITGALSVTGAVSATGAAVSLRPTVTGTADVAVGAAASGTMYVSTESSGTITYTLPAAAAGLWYTFVAGHADGEILITPATGDAIVGKIHAANDGTALAPAAGTGIKNTAATNVAGDTVTLVAVDGTTWYIVAQTGVWASQ
jgi:hypothetical protein